MQIRLKLGRATVLHSLNTDDGTGQAAKQFRTGARRIALGFVVALALAVGGAAARAQNQVPPSAGTPRPSETELKYQAALKKGRQAQEDYFYVTALKYYQEALRLKPGDPEATKLANDMEAIIAGRLRPGEPVPPATPPAAPGQPAAPPPAVVSPPSATPLETVPPPVATPAEGLSRAPKNEISVSADFLYGEGYVTMPFFFSLRAATLQPPGFTTPLAPFKSLQPFVASPPRNSDYIGATLSYSRGQSWFLDLSYANGSSSGSVDVRNEVPGAGFPNTTTSFSLKDDWYQAFIRWVPKSLVRTRFFAYARAGVSYVDATLTDSAVFPPPVNKFNETDRTKDILGNAGFGVGYYFYNGDRLKIALQVEGEGFYGYRTQDSQENLPLHDPPIQGPTVTLNNDLYGGTGRGTVRFQYAFGERGRLKAFADVGAEAKYTFINYSASENFAGGTVNELLWGPYVKGGVRYNF